MTRLKTRFLEWIVVRENLLFAALVAALLVPIWSFRYFPSQDGPAHLNNANVLREYNHPDRSIFREYYVLNKNPEPNWSGHLALAALMSVFPVLFAEKLLLSGYAIMLPVSVRYAIRAINPANAGLAMLSLPFVYNYLFHMGFYNFAYSLPMFFFLVGHWTKHHMRYRFRETAALAAISAVLYFCHLVSVVTAYVAIGLLAATFTLIDTARRPAGFLARASSRIVLPLVAFVPTILLTQNYLRQKGTASGARLAADLQWRRFHTLESLVSYDPREETLARAVFFLFLAAVVYLLTVKAVRWEWSRWDALLALFAAYGVVYFIAPDAMSGGSFISHRLILYPFFALILWFGAQRFHRHAKRAAQVVAVAIALSFLALNMRSYAKLNGYLDDYLSGMERIEPNTTLLPLCFSHRGHGENDEILSKRIGLFLHAAGHIAAQRRIVELDNYEGNTGYFPVLFRYEMNPFRHIGDIEKQPPEVDFLSFNEKTGGTVDYVLVWQLRDLDKEPTKRILSQLERGYERIFTSPRGHSRLYRRKGWSRTE